MKDRDSERLPFRKSVLNHIIAATGFEEDQLRTIVGELLAMGWEKSKIYHELMKGDGTPSTHASNKTEGNLREFGKSPARKRSIRRSHMTGYGSIK